MSQKIAIIGIGQFGYAILKHLDRYKPEYDLFAYDSNAEVTGFLCKNHSHPYLYRNVTVSKKAVVSTDLKLVVEHADVIILAVPSQFTKESVRQLIPFLKKEVIILNTSKALDYTTGKRLSQVIEEELNGISYHYAALSGGTIAKDLFGHEPLGIDIAGEKKEILIFLKELFESETLNVYTTSDLKGVELAGSFKNVISILAGVIKGLGFSYGSETHLISRAAREVEDICIKQHKCDKKTFDMSSQAWGNDLWMSCTGATRNREFGILLGQGMSADNALKQMEKERKTVEGINTIKILPKICDFKDSPILFSAYDIVMNSKDPKTAILDLMKSKKM